MNSEIRLRLSSKKLLRDFNKNRDKPYGFFALEDLPAEKFEIEQTILRRISLNHEDYQKSFKGGYLPILVVKKKNREDLQGTIYVTVGRRVCGHENCSCHDTDRFFYEEHNVGDINTFLCRYPTLIDFMKELCNTDTHVPLLCIYESNSVLCYFNVNMIDQIGKPDKGKIMAYNVEEPLYKIESNKKLFKCSRSRCDVYEELRENGVIKHKSCARCKLVKYCSRECQKLDWPIHKINCEGLHPP